MDFCGRHITPLLSELLNEYKCCVFEEQRTSYEEDRLEILRGERANPREPNLREGGLAVKYSRLKVHLLPSAHNFAMHMGWE